MTNNTKIMHRTNNFFIVFVLQPEADLEGGVRGVRPPPKIRKAYVIQR
jgi:hypothetical protein